EVDLEAERIEPRDVALEPLGIDEVDAPVGGRAAVRVQVRLEHRGGEVLADAVGHDLDGPGLEAADPRARPGLDEALDLLLALVSLPPLAGDHARGQPARLGEAAVPSQPWLRDPGVLPRRDPQAM